MKSWKRSEFTTATGETVAEYTRGDWRITPADTLATAGRETWILLLRGFQQGGQIDASGAGNREFSTPAEAAEYADGRA